MKKGLVETAYAIRISIICFLREVFEAFAGEVRKFGKITYSFEAAGRVF